MLPLREGEVGAVMVPVGIGIEVLLTLQLKRVFVRWLRVWFMLVESLSIWLMKFC